MIRTGNCRAVSTVRSTEPLSANITSAPRKPAASTALASDASMCSSSFNALNPMVTFITAFYDSVQRRHTGPLRVFSRHVTSRHVAALPMRYATQGQPGGEVAHISDPTRSRSMRPKNRGLTSTTPAEMKGTTEVSATAQEMPPTISEGSPRAIPTKNYGSAIAQMSKLSQHKPKVLLAERAT